MASIFVREFRFRPSDDWTPNTDCVFDHSLACEIDVEEARNKYPTTEYRVREYVPKEAE